MTEKLTRSQEAARRNKVKLDEATIALIKWQPTAINIRLESDKCPDCKRAGGFVSYQRPEDLPGGEWHGLGTHEAGMENCGFYCRYCEWGNAGSRQVKP